MSIPKEPRQLMINLMYLVLTALLALNVSAEIINAFFSLEKGIKSTGEVITKNNEATMKALDDAKANHPKEYEQWKPVADKALQVTKEFEEFITGVRQEIFDAAGGPHDEHPDRPRNYKDKDVTTRILVNEGKGAAIQAKIEETRNALLDLFDKEDREKKANELPLVVDEIAHDSKAKTWPEYKFKQMPVAAVMPMFAKFISDSKTSCSAVLNYCLDKASGKMDIKLDKYLVAIRPNKAYLIAGKDRFEADVALGAYSSVANNISITANGQGLPIKEGLAHYSGGVESGTGTRTFIAKAAIKNPATGQVESVEGKFEYEVGQAAVTVAADKMNVFYVGVDNPISVAAAGVSSNSLRVAANGGGATLSGSGKSFMVKCSQPGTTCNIVVSSAEMPSAATFTFRVKRIPDPIAKLGGRSKGGMMGNGEFKAQDGIIPELENFDFDARCALVSFRMTRVGKREDPVTKENSGAKYGSDVRRLVDLAKPGDSYFFDEIKAKCPGDVAGRELNTIAIQIR